MTFFTPTAAFVAQAHMTSGLWPIPIKGFWHLLLPCWYHCQQPPGSRSQTGPQLAMLPLALRWDCAGSGGPRLGGEGDREQAAIATPQAGSHCPRCEGRVFWCNNYPCTTGSPVQFLFTYPPLHVQTKSPTVWLCFGESFHFFFPAPNLRPLVLWVTPPLFQVPPTLPAPGAW